MCATIKQKKAFKEVVNGSTLKGAMQKVGYSVETSKRTNKLTRSKGWQELLDKHLPDSLLAKRHRELLNKRELLGAVDTQAVSKGLDMAYKIKGRYFDAESDKDIQFGVVINLPDQKNPIYKEIKQ